MRFVITGLFKVLRTFNLLSSSNTGSNLKGSHLPIARISFDCVNSYLVFGRSIFIRFYITYSKHLTGIAPTNRILVLLSLVFVIFNPAAAYSDPRNNSQSRNTLLPKSASSDFRRDHTFGFDRDVQTAGHYFRKRSGVRVIRSSGLRSTFSDLHDHQLLPSQEYVPQAETSTRERIHSTLDSLSLGQLQRSLQQIPRLDFLDIRLQLRDLHRTLVSEHSNFIEEPLSAISLSQEKLIPNSNRRRRSFTERALTSVETFADYSNKLINKLIPRFISFTQEFLSPAPAYAVDLEHEIWQFQNRQNGRESFSFEKDTMIRF